MDVSKKISLINQFFCNQINTLESLFRFSRKSHLGEEKEAEKRWNEFFKEMGNRINDEQKHICKEFIIDERYEREEIRVWFEYSYVIGLCSILENYFCRLRNAVSNLSNLNYNGYRKLRINFFDKNRKYFKDAFNIDFYKSGANIKNIKGLITFRNKIVHNSGKINEKIDLKYQVVSVDNFMRIFGFDYKYFEEVLYDFIRLSDYLGDEFSKFKNQ